MDRIADYFADTYSQARAKFLAAVDKGGARLLSSHTNPSKGPTREDCITDVAWIGPDHARKLLAGDVQAIENVPTPDVAKVRSDTNRSLVTKTSQRVVLRAKTYLAQRPRYSTRERSPSSALLVLARLPRQDRPFQARQDRALPSFSRLW